MAGVKETKEMVSAINRISLFLISRLKDGASFDDVMALYSKMTTDQEFRSLIYDAYDKAHKIPAELKDLDAIEAIDLISLQIDFIPLILDALRKP